MMRFISDAKLILANKNSALRIFPEIDFRRNFQKCEQIAFSNFRGDAGASLRKFWKECAVFLEFIQNIIFG
ncbi:hypothetical protein HN358_02740 [Candidatus Uhrbacteria bacterium]|nr:hypothetical protein [Candidatus Uhrbacteria bacterium]MBT7717120.1 hypothetical protein [Candidatus Uhrbacteria bacterium]